MSVRLAAILVLAPACVRIGAYECDGDDACAGAPGGRCEPTGYCSYPDPQCPSGARYSEFAGPYADACTPDEGGDTSSSGSTSLPPSESTTTTTGESSSSGGSSSGGPQPGDVMWQFTHDGGAGDDVFRTVAVFGAVFVVGGQQAVAGQGLDALLVAYDGPEDARWTVVHDFALGLDQIEDLVISPSGDVFVTGEHSPTTGEYRGWVGCFLVETGTACDGWALDGGELSTGGYAGRGIAYASDANVHVAGQESALDRGFVDVRRDWNQTAWPRTVSDAALLAALAVGERKYVAGTLADGLWLGEATARTLVELAASPGPSGGPDAIQALATDGVSIVAVGWVTSLTSRDGWIARFDLEGAPIWETIEGDADFDEEIEGVAIAEDGTIYTAGYVTDLGVDSWVASWTADGELDWSRTDFPLGEGHDIARDVDLLDDGILVVGESTGTDGALDGYAMLLSR